MSVSIVLVLASLALVFLGLVALVIRRHLRWLDRVTPVPSAVGASLLQECVRLSLTADERGIRLGEYSGPARGGFGNEKHRVLYWRTNHRNGRIPGQLAETLSVAEIGREGSFRVTFCDERVVQWSESGTPGRPLNEAARLALIGILYAVRSSARV